MALTLSIENQTTLPDGGPTSIRVTGRRSIDIGRDQHLDWTLPDPTRFISSKHCEIRYHDGGYWLHDVSSNGTFLNGSDRRLHQPHRLKNGDRLEIGQYLIAVRLDGEDERPTPEEVAAPRPTNPEELWSVGGEVAPPIPARELQPPRRSAQARPDFLDWAVELPDVQPPPRMPSAAPPQFRPEPARPGAAAAADALGEAFAPPPRLAPGRSAVPEGWPPPRDHPEPYADRREPTPPAPYPPAPAGGYGETDFLRSVARGAGISEEVFAGRNPAEAAEDLGRLMRIVAENLRQLLAARSEARGVMRTSRKTMIQAVDNNPLKFSPSAEDALRHMFGLRVKSYLGGAETLQQSFEELKAHQLDSFSAMQQALRRLADELDPQSVESWAEGERRLGGVGSRKAKLWEAFLARWDEVAGRHENGLIDAFMLYFTEAYQRGRERAGSRLDHAPQRRGTKHERER
jgi:type VI secretion system protein ImpI